MQRSASLTRSWLELLRIPNLFTVPGDPIAGFMVVTAAAPVAPEARSLVFACVAGLFLYTAGLLLNDLVDIKVDADERPHRPLPSGAISPHTVAILTALLIACGLILGLLAGQETGILAAVLAAAVVAYNLVLKRIPIAGELNLGLCRALNVLLGASAAGAVLNPASAIAAAAICVYIVLVSRIARFEVDALPSTLAAYLPVAALSITIVVCSRGLVGEPMNRIVLGAVLALILVFLSERAARALVSAGRRGADPSIVPASVGQFIRALIPLQAYLVVCSDAPGAVGSAIFVAALYLPATLAGRWIYGS